MFGELKFSRTTNLRLTTQLIAVYKMSVLHTYPNTTVTAFIPLYLSGVNPCSPSATNSGNNCANEPTISWDDTAGECYYGITDASNKVVECKFLWARRVAVELGKLHF